MRHPGPVTQAAISLATWPLVIFSPVILVAGEPVNRYVMRRVRSSAATAPVAVVRRNDRPTPEVTPVQLPLHASLLLMAISNPMWIALTAPGRWVSDRFRRPPSQAGGPVSTP